MSGSTGRFGEPMRDGAQRKTACDMHKVMVSIPLSFLHIIPTHTTTYTIEPTYIHIYIQSNTNELCFVHRSNIAAGAFLV